MYAHHNYVPHVFHRQSSRLKPSQIHFISLSPPLRPKMRPGYRQNIIQWELVLDRQPCPDKSPRAGRDVARIWPGSGPNLARLVTGGSGRVEAHFPFFTVPSPPPLVLVPLFAFFLYFLRMVEKCERAPRSVIKLLARQWDGGNPSGCG